MLIRYLKRWHALAWRYLGQLRELIVNIAAMIFRAAGYGTPPTVTGSSINGSYFVGDYITMSVSASGTAPLAYQWQKNGVNIAGATSSTYSIPSASTGDQASYRCVVSNQWGSATSPTGNVYVDYPTAPSVTVTGGGAYVAGQTVNLYANVSGDGPFTYDWVSPSGAHYSTSASGAFTATDPIESGTFTCYVSSPYGSASDSASVTITYF